MLSIDVTKKCLVAEGWSPVFATKQVPLIVLIQDALDYLVWIVYHIWMWIGLFRKPDVIWLLQIQEALQRATFDSNSQVGAIFQILHTKESPPTYFQTNKFTSAFQTIVDAYGWVGHEGKMHVHAAYLA